jgi:1-acyl-sn-glycerol-3-phosphate acyltransferase
VSGIELEIQGDTTCLGRANSMVMYAHTSTMDAFIMSYCVPGRQSAVAKAELFLIPFFSWLLVAFGGVAIDRGNRGRAVRVLNGLVRGVRGASSCVLIAPEGTRSTTGQLLDFKKGPFYIWEDLKADIIPIVSFGSFELFPPGAGMNLRGKVVVRVLPAVSFEQASSRDQMSALVRRIMLEALADDPGTTDDSFAASTIKYLRTYVLIGGLCLADWYIFSRVQSLLSNYCGLSTSQSVGSLVIASAIITLLVYVYAVYLLPTLSPSVAASTAEEGKIPSSKRKGSHRHATDASEKDD